MERSLAALQALGGKPVYHVSELFGPAGSRATAYRLISRLQELGFAAETRRRGYYTIRSSILQPQHVQLHLLPSLLSLKQARYFGKAYDESDINYARRTLDGIVTLDYRAYELTQLQTPHTFFAYARDPDREAEKLRSSGFSEGRKGRVAILPREGNFENEVQRVYLDCLAFGGRSTLDAIAIELLHGDHLEVRGEYPVELVLKVKEDLPTS